MGMDLSVNLGYFMMCPSHVEIDDEQRSKFTEEELKRIEDAGLVEREDFYISEWTDSLGYHFGENAEGHEKARFHEMSKFFVEFSEYGHGWDNGVLALTSGVGWKNSFVAYQKSILTVGEARLIFDYWGRVYLLDRFDWFDINEVTFGAWGHFG